MLFLHRVLSLSLQLFGALCPTISSGAVFDLLCRVIPPFPQEVLASVPRALYIRSMVLELPPAPAALVLVGRAFATLSALSAAAFLLIAVLGPPGGDKFRPLLTPAEAGGEAGEEGEDYV